MRFPKLKHKSPEFDDLSQEEKIRCCDIPGCPGSGEFRAPKSRDEVREYYWFCLDHVRDYNRNWNYFEGMSPGEIEHRMTAAMTWERPTWQMSINAMSAERLKQRVYEGFRMDGGASDSVGGDWEEKIHIPDIPAPEIEALAVLGLEPPVNWDDIKTRYKKLAKKYHPDMTGQDADAEEVLKKINISYTILKVSYRKYTELDAR